MTGGAPERPRPRQDRSIATRAAILEAAARRFIAFGYSDATLARITQNEGFTNGALYHHFPTREALARAIVDEYEQRAADIVTTTPHTADDPLRAVLVMSRRLAEGLLSDRILLAGITLTTEVGSPFLDRQPYRPWVEAVTPSIRLCQEQGVLRADVDAADVSAFVVATFAGIQLVSAAESGREDLLERLRTGWALVLGGLTLPGTADRAAETLAAVFATS
jgi:AcrR family transcriptional regulator